MNIIRTNCDLCNSTNEHFSNLFTINNYNIVKCNSCSLVFVLEIPDIKELKNFYDKPYFEGEVYKSYSGQELERKRYFLRQLMYFENYYKSYAGNLLEIGSATGSFLECAHFLGYDCIGTEKSEYAFKIAKSKNLKVFNGDLSELTDNENFGKESFNAVFMWDVIEHLISPSSTLKHINCLMKPGGLLTLNTLNISSPTVKFLREKWSQFLPPAHLFFFSIRTLNRYLSRYSFKVIKLKTDGPLFYDDLTNKYHLFGSIFSNKLVQKVTNRMKLGFSQFLIAKKIIEG